MKLDEFKKNIKIFLDEQDKSVLLVKGNWGVGKSHYISEAINDHENYKIIKLSLFGIDSIDDVNIELSNNILENTITKSGSDVIKTVASIPYLSKFLPTKELDITKLNIRLSNVIIFFDDIERSALSFEQIFGCIDKLKNNTSFKIIVALNDDPERDNNKVETNIIRYKEKVVDSEIRLISTLDVVIRNIFKNESDVEIALKVFNSLEIYNLRSVIKSEQIMKFFVEKSEGLSESNCEKLKISCLVYSAIYFSYGSFETKGLELDEKIDLFDIRFKFNDLIKSYIDSQAINMDFFKKYNNDLISQQDTLNAREEHLKLKGLIEHTFDNNEDEIIEQARKIINDNKSDSDSFLFSLEILQMLNSKVEINSISKLERYINEYNISKYISIFEKFGDTELVKVLESKKELFNKKNDNDINDSDVILGNIFLYLEQASYSNFNDFDMFKEELSEVPINDWKYLFENGECLPYIKSKIEIIIQILKSDSGGNLRSAIIELSKNQLNKYRLSHSFYTNLVYLSESYGAQDK